MEIKEILKNHYEPRLEKYTDNSKVLDWESREAQLKRFSALTDNYDLNSRSFLDVGCGCGDLYGLLNELGINADYSGVDILDRMIERAKKSYPGGNFKCVDIFSSEFSILRVFGRETFDVVFTSGIFNLNAGNNEAFLKKALSVFASIAREAFIFNLLDPSSPDIDNKYFYLEPAKALDLASGYAESCELIKGYLDNDYTVICRKQK